MAPRKIPAQPAVRRQLSRRRRCRGPSLWWSGRGDRPGTSLQNTIQTRGDTRAKQGGLVPRYPGQACDTQRAGRPRCGSNSGPDAVNNSPRGFPRTCPKMPQQHWTQGRVRVDFRWIQGRIRGGSWPTTLSPGARARGGLHLGEVLALLLGRQRPPAHPLHRAQRAAVAEVTGEEHVAEGAPAQVPHLFEVLLGVASRKEAGEERGIPRQHRARIRPQIGSNSIL